MSAETIDNDNNNNNTYNHINKKRSLSHNITQKYKPSINSHKVNSILQSIHNIPEDDNELSASNYGSQGSSVLKDNFDTAKHSDNFKPLNPYDFPDKPISGKEGMQNVPQPMENEEHELNNFNKAFMNDAQVRDYYRKLVPAHQPSNNNQNPNNKKYYTNTNAYPNTNTNTYNTDSNQMLLDKLNYVINLLEEQQDQKTNNVTEEVVLYSFLGIFIIFIVDSFTKVGKYIR